MKQIMLDLVSGTALMCIGGTLPDNKLTAISIAIIGGILFYKGLLKADKLN